MRNAKMSLNVRTKSKNLCYLIILTSLLSGCNSDAPSTTFMLTPKPTTPTEPTEPTRPPRPNKHLHASSMPSPLPPSTAPNPNPTPDTAPEPPEPTPTPLPVFIGEGITTRTQNPYSGSVNRGGDDYLRFDQDAKTIDKFILPTWTVDYKYDPFLEILITDGVETLCARYSWKSNGFGYAQQECFWSSPSQALPIEDLQAAYYGYSIVETRVWISGVVGAVVGIE